MKCKQFLPEFNCYALGGMQMKLVCPWERHETIPSFLAMGKIDRLICLSSHGVLLRSAHCLEQGYIENYHFAIPILFKRRASCSQLGISVAAKVTLTKLNIMLYCIRDFNFWIFLFIGLCNPAMLIGVYIQCFPSLRLVTLTRAREPGLGEG